MKFEVHGKSALRERKNLADNGAVKREGNVEGAFRDGGFP